MELKEGDAKLFARYIAQDIREYFKTEEHRKEFEEYYFLQAKRVCRDAYPLTFIKPSIPFVVIKEHITINYSRQTL